MLKKTIKYKDLNGLEVEEDFYFHLNKADIVELELGAKGGEGLEYLIKRVVASKDGQEILDIFKKIILMSYGERSMDGSKFIRNEILREDFRNSEAYASLFVELALNAEKGAEFINGIMPDDLRSQVNELTQTGNAGTDVDARPLYQRENRRPTDSELQTMSKAEMQEAFKFHPSQG